MADITDFMDGIAGAIDEDVQDAVLLEAGEHQVKLVSMNFRVSEENEENPSPRYNFGFEPVDNDEADLIWFTLWLPHSSQDGRRRRRSNRDLKSFCEAMGLGWPTALPFEEDIMKDLTTYAEIGTEVYEGETKNKIVRFVKAS